MIHLDSDLFYDIYNTIDEYNWRQTHYISSILSYLKKFFYNFIRFIINHYFYVITFECITLSSSSSKEDI